MRNDPIDARRHAPATTRNREPILAVLARVLPAGGHVLEIASGSGEHATYFAARLPGLTWQPSDPDPDARSSIDAHRVAAGVENVQPALPLDVMREPWPIDGVDAIVCINMIHIAPWAACEALFSGASKRLSPRGVLFLYGPYKRGGAHTAPSNEAFDESLRARDPSWGVRDLEAVTKVARDHDFTLEEVVEMPANNLSVVFRRL
jgi:cyclopropane fatty-acyl-phospholipid synthase-like methyltransferase